VFFLDEINASLSAFLNVGIPQVVEVSAVTNTTMAGAVYI